MFSFSLSFFPGLLNLYYTLKAYEDNISYKIVNNDNHYGPGSFLNEIFS